MKKTLSLLLLLIPLFIFGNDFRKNLEADAQFFNDITCTELSPKFKKKHLKQFKTEELRNVAEALLSHNYDETGYRTADYSACMAAERVSRELKLGRGFSKYENITGMYLEEGQAIIIVGNTNGKQINLLLPFWMRKPAEGVQPTKDPNGWGLKVQKVPLTEGINIIDVERSTNAYIDYFDEYPETAPEIKIHFVSGKVNGYFDANIHNNEDWNRLLDNAVSPIMDAMGKYIQVAYPVEFFKEFTYGKGKELIAKYDEMLTYEYELMGFYKYNKVPKNKILARVNFNYYMFRDGDGVAYLGDKNTMRKVADPDKIVGDGAWGFCHEVGHVLQMRTWGGMGEVSNNILTMYATTKLGHPSRLTKTYQKAREAIIEADSSISYLQNGDHFIRLVPFWQLHLYFTQNGYSDFYPDFMEAWRNRPDREGTSQSIMDFVKLVCDIGKTDLTDFFEKWGFFHIAQFPVNDYGKFEYNVTPEMVNDVKTCIASKNYPKPTMDVTRIED